METTMGTLTFLALAFAAGLIVGWNVLPQPKWVADLYAKAKARFQD